MSRLFVGVFEQDGDVAAAAEAAREHGLHIADVYTPYAVHGLDRALGLRPSRLSGACLLFGLLGVGVALWLQFWTSAVDWPLNVGGRPWNSLPAFVPVTFELMVLCAGLGVVATFLAVSRLYPGKGTRLPYPGVTDNRFVLVLKETDAAFDAGTTRRLLEHHGAVHTEEREESEVPTGERPARRVLRRAVNVCLLLLLLTVGALNWLTGTDPGRPNQEFLPEMAHSPRYNTFSANPNFPDGQTQQPPVPGTIARGMMPLHYRATPEDALRAGEELHSPLKTDDIRAQQRGASVFVNYCQICHGPGGKGDGPATQRGVPPPPSLLAEKALRLKDGQIFHILTYGQGNMASYAGQLSREDRWHVILHVRALQKQVAGEKRP
jgi:mono/diheme cytochrome c family protein